MKPILFYLLAFVSITWAGKDPDGGVERRYDQNDFDCPKNDFTASYCVYKGQPVLQNPDDVMTQIHFYEKGDIFMSSLANFSRSDVDVIVNRMHDEYVELKTAHQYYDWKNPTSYGKGLFVVYDEYGRKLNKDNFFLADSFGERINWKRMKTLLDKFRRSIDFYKIDSTPETFIAYLGQEVKWGDHRVNIKVRTVGIRSFLEFEANNATLPRKTFSDLLDEIERLQPHLNQEKAFKQEIEKIPEDIFDPNHPTEWMPLAGKFVPLLDKYGNSITYTNFHWFDSNGQELNGNNIVDLIKSYPPLPPIPSSTGSPPPHSNPPIFEGEKAGESSSAPPPATDLKIESVQGSADAKEGSTEVSKVEAYENPIISDGAAVIRNYDEDDFECHPHDKRDQKRKYCYYKGKPVLRTPGKSLSHIRTSASKPGKFVARHDMIHRDEILDRSAVDEILNEMHRQIMAQGHSEGGKAHANPTAASAEASSSSLEGGGEDADALAEEAVGPEGYVRRDFKCRHVPQRTRRYCFYKGEPVLLTPGDANTHIRVSQSLRDEFGRKKFVAAQGDKDLILVQEEVDKIVARMHQEYEALRGNPADAPRPHENLAVDLDIKEAIHPAEGQAVLDATHSGEGSSALEDVSKSEKDPVEASESSSGGKELATPVSDVGVLITPASHISSVANPGVAEDSGSGSYRGSVAAPPLHHIVDDDFYFFELPPEVTAVEAIAKSKVASSSSSASGSGTKPIDEPEAKMGKADGAGWEGFEMSMPKVSSSAASPQTVHPPQGHVADYGLSSGSDSSIPKVEVAHQQKEAVHTLKVEVISPQQDPIHPPPFQASAAEGASQSGHRFGPEYHIIVDSEEELSECDESAWFSSDEEVGPFYTGDLADALPEERPPWVADFPLDVFDQAPPELTQDDDWVYNGPFDFPDEAGSSDESTPTRAGSLCSSTTTGGHGWVIEFYEESSEDEATAAVAIPTAAASEPVAVKSDEAGASAAASISLGFLALSLMLTF